jgi:hypothetical protein
MDWDSLLERHGFLKADDLKRVRGDCGLQIEPASRSQPFFCALRHFAQRNFWAERMRAKAAGDNFRRRPMRALPGKRRAAIALLILSNSLLRRLRSCSRAASTGVNFAMREILSGNQTNHCRRGRLHSGAAKKAFIHRT